MFKKLPKVFISSIISSIICPFIFFLIFLIVFSFTSCSSKTRKQISVANWNLQTFFDANFDGNEYSEYKNSKSGWSKEKYEVRLKRLENVIKTLDCDFFIMEELEKQEQLFDIVNQLSSTFDSTKMYKYGYFASEKDSSIGCGIISRVPFFDVKIHSIEVYSEQNRPSMRPIIQFSVKIDNKEVVFFVNHWKSKSGGKEKSDIWRDYQEKRLSSLMKKCLDEGKAVFACGDFNRSIEEFEYKKNGENNIVLKGGTEVFSPWFDENENIAEIGSYFFHDEWEYIDNFFASKVKISDFKVQSVGEWAEPDGVPNRYKVYTGNGYSDHLPITCKLKF